jgi:hypothetical protein
MLNIERRATFAPFCTLRIQISSTLYNVAHLSHMEYANACGHFQFYTKQGRKYTNNVILRRVRLTTVGVVKQ